MAGFDLTGLTDFSNEVAGKIVPKIVFEGYTTSVLPIQQGIKHIEPLNIFDVDLVIQSGSCVSTPGGSFNATQRNIQVTPRTSFDGLCLDDLNTKYLGISALDRGSYNTSFALAETYTDLIVNQMKKADDQFLWDNTNLGLLTSGSTTGVVTPAAANIPFIAADALLVIDTLIDNLDADVADREDLTVWMSVTNFRRYTTALRQANNYFFDPGAVENRGGIFQMQYPFQNVKVIGTTGLQGSDRVVLMPDAYAVVGVDDLSDETNFSLFFDMNADQLKHRLKSKLGVQVAFPEYIVSNNRN
tara:strand:- start:427 stop:1329 length:903 start_codon:yes stop_codon:yes gene_type:complete